MSGQERIAWSSIRHGDASESVSRLGCCAPKYSKLGMTGDSTSFAAFITAWPSRLDLPHKNAIGQLFAEMDTDQNDFLNLPEIAAGVRKLFPEFDMPSALMAAYSVADVNKDGAIQKAEFARLCELLQFTNNNVTTFAQVVPKGNLGVEFESSTGRDATVKTVTADATWADKLQVGDILLGPPGTLAEKMQAVKDSSRPLHLTFARLPDPSTMVPFVDSAEIRGHLEGAEEIVATTMAKLVRLVYPGFGDMKVLMQAFSASDRMPDGSMTPDQFISMMHALRILSNDAAAFNEIDVALTNDGQLDLDGFLTACRRLGMVRLDEPTLRREFGQMTGSETDSPQQHGIGGDAATVVASQLALSNFHRWAVDKIVGWQSELLRWN